MINMISIFALSQNYIFSFIQFGEIPV